MPKQTSNQHLPVLAAEVLQYLGPKKGEAYADFTAGYGGHAQAIIDITQSSAVLVDRDEHSARFLQSKFADQNGVEIINKDFESASRDLIQQGEDFDLILADLGLSSPHLDNPERGFAFASDGPLDMRMDQNQELDARAIVNSYSAEQLAELFFEYGDEPKSRKIAQDIVGNRPINSTAQLAQIVKRSWPGRSKSHPATRVFQALRIAVNDEIGQLERSLPQFVDLLRPGGRLGIITFHSIEDRIVKNYFKSISENLYDSSCELLSRKPVAPAESELVHNPRARSAKLRLVRKRK